MSSKNMKNGTDFTRNIEPGGVSKSRGDSNNFMFLI